MKNLLVSFSGGETSAFMSQWLSNHADEHGYENVVFVFANTGVERNETLTFVKQCDTLFNLNVHWVEALVNSESGAGTTHVSVNFETATRNTDWRTNENTPFEQVIRKYGIPNISTPHCTRELKERPISSFAREYFKGEKYHTAIGIRTDEVDRINPNRKAKGFIYPLIHKHMIPATKPMINFYWRSQPYRLNLKGYQGNCAACWKKADKKLYAIANEGPEFFEFMAEMERKYGGFIPKNRLYSIISSGNEPPKSVSFYRKNRTALDIVAEARKWKGKVHDDSTDYNYQLDLIGGESCEVFSECGH
jgi:hypothetical protein